MDFAGLPPWSLTLLILIAAALLALLIVRIKEVSVEWPKFRVLLGDRRRK